MSQPIDRAYVEIEARGEDDAARDIKRALDKIARDVDKLGKQISASLDETARDIEQELTEAGSILTKEAVRQRREWQKTGTELSLAMKEAATSAETSIDNFSDEAVRDMNRITNAAVRAATAVKAAGSGRGGGVNVGDGVDVDGIGSGDRDVDNLHRSLSGLKGVLSGLASVVAEVADALAERLGEGARRAGQALGTLTGVISTVLGPIGALISSIGMIAAIGALLPVLIPIIAALSQLSALLLLLPGSIAVLVGALAPLIIAFQGVGEAVSALASGDLEKINEAMKKISPEARKFALEVHSIRDELKELKFVVQDAFFSKLNGELSALVRDALPTLKAGLADVSDSMGGFLAQIMQMLRSRDVLSSIGNIFEGIGRIIDRLAGPFTGFLETVISMTEESMPFVERFFGVIGDGFEKFSKWMEEAIASGDFERWMENAFSVAKDLWGLLKSIGRLLGAVFGGFGDEGQTFIQDMTDGINKLAEWFESPEGKKELQELVDGFLELSKAIVTAVGALVKIAKWFADRKQDWEDFKTDVKEAKDAIVDFFDSAWEKVESVGKTIGEFFSGLGDKLGEARDAVAEKGQAILTWFEELPGKISTFLSELPGKISGFFRDALDQALYNVGYGIGLIVAGFVGLPTLIWNALQDLWNTITTWFTQMRDTISERAFEIYTSVTEWFDKLPGRVATAASNLWTTVSDWFSRTRDRAVERARSLANSVINYFREMPGRTASALAGLPSKVYNVLRDAVNKARDIGRDIMEGVARGIRNGWNAAINAAKDAARQIMKGFWDALEIGSPSKLTARTVGIPIMQGVGVGVERGVPDLRSTIDSAVNSAISSTQTNAASEGAQAAPTGGGGGGIVIQNLSIPIQGTWDFADPATARKIAYNIHQALQDLQRDYR